MTDALPRLPDGSVDTSQDLGGAFDDILDEVHSTQAQSTGEPSTAELDEIRAAERTYWDALTHEVNDRLRSQRITVTHVLEDHVSSSEDEGGGWIVCARDPVGREFSARVTVAAMAALGERYGEEMGRHVIDQVCSQLLAARERYFARMV